MADGEVRHEEGARFFIIMDTGEQAVLEYSTQPDGVLDLFHTEVPATHRGKGIGAILAEAALTYARDSGLHVCLTCTYLQHYVSKHPEYTDLLTQ